MGVKTLGSKQNVYSIIGELIEIKAKSVLKRWCKIKSEYQNNPSDPMLSFLKGFIISNEKGKEKENKM